MRERKFEVREVFNPYLNKNLFQVTRQGFCLLPPEQHGAYETLDEAKDFIRKYKSSGGIVYIE